MTENENTFCEAEMRRLRKIENFLVLPNQFKKIGLILFVLSFIILIAIKIIEIESRMGVSLLKQTLLVSLLLMAVSREKIEDELIAMIRGRAFSLAFICGVIYALVQPYFDFLVIELVKGGAIHEEMNAFQLLFVMLGVYLMFFHVLKRTR